MNMHTRDQHTAESSRSLFRVMVILLVLVGTVTAGTWLAMQLSAALQFRARRAHVEAIRAIVRSWRPPPPDAKVADWEAAWEIIDFSIGNVCWHISAEELEHLRNDVEQMNQMNKPPVTMDTLEWLWVRLSQTGPQGNRNHMQFQPMWDEVARKPAATAGTATSP